MQLVEQAICTLLSQSFIASCGFPSLSGFASQSLKYSKVWLRPLPPFVQIDSLHNQPFSIFPNIYFVRLSIIYNDL